MARLIVFSYCTFIFALQANADLFDLNSDWSDTSNPNGTWSLRAGTDILQLGTLSVDFSQPGWTGANGNVLPLWIKAQSTAGFDLAVGDIVTHTTDAGNGGSNGLSNVAWTSPNSGTIDIAGSVWMVRDIGRSNDWFVRLNGSLLSSGQLSSGDIYSRVSPFDLDTGSGGSLNGIAIASGDVVELSFARTTTFGDYVGVNFSVDLTVVPEPGNIFVLLWFLAAVGTMKRPRSRAGHFRFHVADLS